MSFHPPREAGKKGFGFGGFSLKSKGTGPETQMAQMGLGVAGMPGIGMAGRHFASSSLGKKRVKSEEEYFEDEGEDLENLEYQPAPGSPSADRNVDNSPASSDSDDPLEAFMTGIKKEVHEQDLRDKGMTEEEIKKKGIRDDIDNEDVEEAYYRYMEENPMAGVIMEDDDIVEYDADGNAIIPDKKIIDPLPEIDHSDIDYEPFNKNFYEEHPEIQSLTQEQVAELRNKLGIRVSGIDPPKPVSSFGHFGFDEKLIKSIVKAGYTQPMPIQAQGIPIGLSGRDIIGIAKTGSGKTAAFIWPLLVHIMDQRELKPGEGPVGLICAPTRELSQQIYHEAKKFGKVYNIKVVCAYGGGSLYEQCKACEEGAEIIVCTPGRLIDLVKKKATNLQRVTYLVFDEADRMFDMGFEPQVRSIANHVRPNRQSCYNCQETGHIQSACPKAPRPKACYTCGETGHLSRDCDQSDRYDRGGRGGNKTCYNCGESGHFARECPQADSKGKSDRSDIVCYNCNEAGHISRDCPDRKQKNQDTECYSCHKMGHFARDCPEKA